MLRAHDIRVGDLRVLPHEHVVLVRDEVVPLTSREYEMVLHLAEHPGWVFSADQLAGESDGETADYSPESVSVLISRLRQKLAAAGAPEVVETVRGFGYRLHPDGAPGELGTTDAAPSCTIEELRDAAWDLQEVVIEMTHTGDPAQRRVALDALETARRAIDSALKR